MKKILLTLFAAALLSATPQSVEANAALDKFISAAMKKVKGVKDLKSIQKIICRKANAFRGKASIRTAKGEICNTQLGAAIALYFCSGYVDGKDKFDDSSCAKKANKIFEETDAKAVLKDAAGKAKSEMSKLICTIGLKNEKTKKFLLDPCMSSGYGEYPPQN